MCDCMTTSPVPTSCMVCPVEDSTLPAVFYSVFKLVLACSVSTVLETSIVCKLLRCGLRSKCPESWEK